MTLTLRMGDQIITDQVTNIQTKNLMTGGYAAVTFNVKRKLDRTLFDTFTNVFTYDPATGEQTGGGRLLEQGREDDGTWKVTCLGEGLASMQDVTTPVFYVDTTMDSWVRSSRTTSKWDVTVGNYPVQSDDEQTLVLDTKDGVQLFLNDEAVMLNRLPTVCNQRIGGLGFRAKAGQSNVNFRTRGTVYSYTHSSATNTIDVAWDTTISGRLVMTVNGDFTDKYDAAISFKRITGASSTSDDTFWATARDIIITAQIYGANGSLITTGYDREYILSHEVLTDWVVRYCPRLNAATGSIGVSAKHIEQMTYLEGVHGVQLADEVAALESAFIWQVWGQGTDGRWPFNYVPVSTGVQYEASTADGFTAPSPTNEIYDEVVVTGKNPSSGRDTSLLITSTVPSLVAAGIHRRATIPLGSEVWSNAAATQVGNDFLASHSFAPGAGTITIARRIFDAVQNRWIGPQHIRAGGLIRVRGIQPTTNPLNATAADGVTVFRILSATYDNDSNSTVCELDAYTVSQARVVAELTKTAPTPRGKHK